MKTKLLVPAFFIVLLLFSFQYKDDDHNHNHNENLINNVLNEIVSKDSTIITKDYQMVDGFNSANQIRSYMYVHKRYFESLHPYFQKEDIDFYKKQIDSSYNSKLLKERNFRNLKFIDKEKVTEFIAKSEYNSIKDIKYDFYGEFEKKIGKIQEFGLPLFSKDKKYVMIRYYRMSAVPKRVKGFCRIYEKQNDQWLIVKTVDDWEDNGKEN